MNLTMAGFNLSMTHGDNVTLNLAVTQAGAAYNLTGASIRMTAKRSVADADADAVFTVTVGTGITVTNAAGGLATINLAPAHTSSLPNAYAWLLPYDVQVTDSGGRVFTVIAGTIAVQPEITITVP